MIALQRNDDDELGAPAMMTMTCIFLAAMIVVVWPFVRVARMAPARGPRGLNRHVVATPEQLIVHEAEAIAFGPRR